MNKVITTATIAVLAIVTLAGCSTPQRQVEVLQPASTIEAPDSAQSELLEWQDAHYAAVQAVFGQESARSEAAGLAESTCSVFDSSDGNMDLAMITVVEVNEDFGLTADEGSLLLVSALNGYCPEYVDAAMAWAANY